METYFQTIQQAHSNLARQRVVTDFKKLARDAEDLLKATAGDVREGVKQARARLASGLEQPAATCRRMEERSLAQAKETALWANSMVRQHPYACVGSAFAAGLLLSVWIARE